MLPQPDSDPESENKRLEDATDRAIAMCNGDLRRNPRAYSRERVSRIRNASEGVGRIGSATRDALDLLACDLIMHFQDLANEAFRDLLGKHGRPINLNDALSKKHARLNLSRHVRR